MNDIATLDAYGAFTDTDTLTIKRLLPGTIERAWAYLTESDLRQKWLAAGDMTLKVGAPFQLIWRNDELSNRPTCRPPEFSEEQRMDSQILEVDPPRKLRIGWGAGDVTFDLERQGDSVLLTITHTRLGDRATRLMIGAGWHMHLNLLAAVAANRKPESFWEGWLALREVYDRRLPA